MTSIANVSSRNLPPIRTPDGDDDAGPLVGMLLGDDDADPLVGRLLGDDTWTDGDGVGRIVDRSFGR